MHLSATFIGLNRTFSLYLVEQVGVENKAKKKQYVQNYVKNSKLGISNFRIRVCVLENIDMKVLSL